MSKNLEDIARMAGVSRSTVSRVINNDPHVRESTRQKVLEVVQQERFMPNPAARTLASRRTHVLGVVTPQHLPEFFSDPYFPFLLQGISAAANRHDYAIMLWVGEGSEEEERFYRRISDSRLMDGVVVASVVNNDPLLMRLTSDAIPLVFVGRPWCAGFNSVDVDNRHGARVAVEHLLNLGYQRIGTITGRRDIPSGQDRLEGYLEALRGIGRSPDPALIVDGTFSETSGYLGMKVLLQRGVDAVFCASDMMAAGALRAIHEQGLHVPDDVALVSFDDLPIAAALDPPLTTIRQPIRRLGQVATETLISFLENGATPHRVLLPTELVIRGSCGARTR